MPARRQAGLTLIEVLIAVVVLSLGLLGIAGLQSATLANNLISYQNTQAATLAQGMVERMRANRTAVITGAYDLAADATPMSAPVNCGTTVCLPVDQARWDLALLYAAVAAGADTTNLPDGPRALLPGGRLAITCDAACDADSLRIVTVFWDALRRAPETVDCEVLQCVRLGYQP